MTTDANAENNSSLPIFKRYRKSIRMDVTLFLAIVTGVMIMSGYAHLEKYYLTLDVPIDRLNFSLQKIGAYGGASLGSLFSAFATAVAMVAFIMILIALMESPDKKPQKNSQAPVWKNRIMRRGVQLVLVIKLVAFLIALAGLAITLRYLLISAPSDSGRLSALKTVSKCYEHHLVYANTSTYDGCIVAESEDTIYLVKRLSADKSQVTFRTFQLLKAGLEKADSDEQTLKFDG